MKPETSVQMSSRQTADSEAKQESRAELKMGALERWLSELWRGGSVVKALVALSKDSGFSPSTYTVAYNHL